MTPTAQSLILDLVSASVHQEIPVRLLIPVARLFGVTENNIRVALARLVARGLLVRGRRGVYRLSEGAWPVQRHVASWARTEERTTDWTGGWVGVHLSRPGQRTQTANRRRRRALSVMGFRELEPGLWIRPDNLKGGVEEVRTRLRELGLDGLSRVFGLRELDPETERSARSLWDVEQLERSYRTLTDTLKESAARLQGGELELEQALAESFTVGGQVLHELAFDPLLPEEILPAKGRRALVHQMRRYDRLGREHWDRFARLNGISELALPLSCAVDEGVRPLQAQGGAE